MGVLTVRTLLITKLRQTCRERFAHLFSSLFLGAASLLRHAMALGMCMSPGGGQQRVGLFLPLLVVAALHVSAEGVYVEKSYRSLRTRNTHIFWRHRWDYGLHLGCGTQYVRSLDS